MIKKALQWVLPTFFEASASENIELNERRFDWGSSDPQCQLKPENCWGLPLFGFYMLELSCEESSRHQSKLYFDQGDGFFEKFSLELVTPYRGVSKRVVFFDKPVNSLRWDPAESAGYVISPKLKFVKLSKSRAIKLMTKKLYKCSSEDINISKLKRYSDVNAIIEKYMSHFKNLRSTDQSYLDWINNSEPNFWRPKKVDEIIKFSIVVPTFNTKPAWLRELVDSLVQQSYSNWQLIIVDDASTQASTLGALESITKHDSRINITRRSTNGHISQATNDGIKLATGQYVCFLDHDDLLSPYALNELANEIAEFPKAKLIYSDEDLMSEDGERIAPHFKPDWNPELLKSHNYITHLACYQKDFLIDLGGLRIGYEGAQDYDLALRASLSLNADQIRHIPKVLYHWRMVEGSTALSSGAKSYATEAGFNALKDFMKAVNSDATVMHSDRDNFYKVHWPLSENLHKVSVIVPTRDGLEVLVPCIDGLLHNTAYSNLEIVILDNGSQKIQTLNYLKELECNKKVKVIRDEGRFNYSRINNLAVGHATGDIICLLNNDTEVIHPNWLTEMVSLAIRPEVGCVGAKLLYPDNTIQHAGVILGLGGYAAHSHRGIDRYDSGYFCRAQLRQNFSAVTAACLVVRREVYDHVLGLDESFSVAYNDVDFCLRVQTAGFRNIYTPYAELYHHESKTRGDDSSADKQARFDQEKARLLSRWSTLIQNDPSYNINLTRSNEQFSIRVPYEYR